MTLVLELITGVAAGFLAGMFGVGGGILMVPAMVLLLDFAQLEAQATSLAAMLPALAAGALRQRHFGNVRVKAARTVAVCSVAGVALGTGLATNLPEATLRVLFSLLLLAVAFRLVWEVRRQRRAPAIDDGGAGARGVLADPLAPASSSDALGPRL